MLSAVIHNVLRSERSDGRFSLRITRCQHFFVEMPAKGLRNEKRFDVQAINLAIAIAASVTSARPPSTILLIIPNVSASSGPKSRAVNANSRRSESFPTFDGSRWRDPTSATSPMSASCGWYESLSSYSVPQSFASRIVADDPFEIAVTTIKAVGE